MKRHLIIFSRAAQLGRVKRRLAAEIGALAALRFHRAMQAQLMQTIAKDRRWRTWIAITPDSGATNNIINQGRGDLGRRMARSFSQLPPGPVVLVGSDIPGIMPAHIARAFAELGRNDYVFGRATDGGYWLVGLKRVRAQPHGLFKAVRWSGPEALCDTVKGLAQARIGYVDTLSDIDTGASYHHWRRLCSSRRGMISTKLQGRNR